MLRARGTGVSEKKFGPASWALRCARTPGARRRPSWGLLDRTGVLGWDDPMTSLPPSAPSVPSALDMPPREFVEWMEQQTGKTDLWWQLKERGAVGDWHWLESVGQIADLVHRIVEPGDMLTLEDDDPISRYAQVMHLGEGRFMVEIAKAFETGAYNWRIGRGRAGEDAENVPGGLVTNTQELNAAETIETLSSWAQGHGLPLGYGASLHVYGDVAHPAELEEGERP